MRLIQILIANKKDCKRQKMQKKSKIKMGNKISKRMKSYLKKKIISILKITKQCLKQSLKAKKKQL